MFISFHFGQSAAQDTVKNRLAEAEDKDKASSLKMMEMT
jgi:hypothetical protein